MPSRCGSCVFVTVILYSILFQYYYSIGDMLTREAVERVARAQQNGTLCPRADDDHILSVAAFTKRFFASRPNVEVVYPWVLGMVGANRVGGNSLLVDDTLHIFDWDVDISLSGKNLTEEEAGKVTTDFVQAMRETGDYPFVFWLNMSCHSTERTKKFSAVALSFSPHQHGWYLMDEVPLILEYKLWPWVSRFLGLNMPSFPGLEGLTRALWFPLKLLAAPILSRILIVDFHVTPNRVLKRSGHEKILWAGQEWAYPANDGQEFVEAIQRYNIPINLPDRSELELCDFARMTPALFPEDIEIVKSSGVKEIIDSCTKELHSKGYKSFVGC